MNLSNVDFDVSGDYGFSIRIETDSLEAKNIGLSMYEEKGEIILTLFSDDVVGGNSSNRYRKIYERAIKREFKEENR